MITNASNQLSLSPYSFTTSNDLLEVVSQQCVEQKVKNLEKTYYTIDVKEAMANLSQVGSLLQLAYAGTKSHKSSLKVTPILCDYQFLIKDSLDASSTFVQACLLSVKHHKHALNCAEKSNFDVALTFLSKSAELAAQMAEASGTLADKSQKLCDQSKDALISATEDGIFSEEVRKKMVESVNEFKAQEAALKIKTQDLADQVEEERAKEKAAANKADQSQQRAFVLSVMSAVTKPLTEIGSCVLTVYNPASTLSSVSKIGSGVLNLISSNSEKKDKKEGPEDETLNKISKTDKEVTAIEDELKVKQKLLDEEVLKGEDADTTKVNHLKKEIVDLESQVSIKRKVIESLTASFKEIQTILEKQTNTYQSQEEKIAQRRAALQKEQREANAKLAEAVERLKGLNVQHDDINKSIVSLDIAVKTLGKIRTVFDNARLFWKGVEKQCKILADTDTIKLLAGVDPEEFTKELRDAALGWAVLGKINIVANTSMLKVNRKFDQIMSNLPTKEESTHLIEKISSDILTQINAEVKIEEITENSGSGLLAIRSDIRNS